MAKYFEVSNPSGTLRVKFYALNLKQIQEREDELEEVVNKREGESPFSKERFARLIKYFTLSAQLGNPKITEDEVSQVVDLDNMANVTRAIMGMTDKIPQADKDAAAIVTPMLPQIGADFTQG